MREGDIVRKVAESCGLEARIQEPQPGWASAEGVYRGRSVQIDDVALGCPFLAIFVSIFNPLKAVLSLHYYADHPAVSDFVKGGLAVVCGESVSGHFTGEEKHLDHMGQILRDNPDLCHQIAQSRMCFGLDVYPLNRWGKLRIFPYVPYWNPFSVAIEDWLVLVDLGVDLAGALEEYLRQSA